MKAQMLLGGAHALVAQGFADSAEVLLGTRNAHLLEKLPPTDHLRARLQISLAQVATITKLYHHIREHRLAACSTTATVGACAGARG